MPKKPTDFNYEELKKILHNYIDPKPNTITERYKFRDCKQSANESIMQFVTTLKKMSEHCEFGLGLDEALRDQMIWGIKDINIKKRLLLEDSLSLKKCVELSTAMESACKDVSKLEQCIEMNYQKWFNKKKTMKSSSFKEADAVRSLSSHTTSRTQEKNVQDKNIYCYCCGGKGHKKPLCKYKSYKCNICLKIGHLGKICKAKIRAKTKSMNNLEECDLNLDNLFNLEVNNMSYVKPFYVKINVEGQMVNFQIDTGSGVSVISSSDLKYANIGKCDSFEKTDVSLKAYNGTIIIR